MSNDTNDRKPPTLPRDTNDPRWKKWRRELHVAVDDHDAVTRDLLRKERNRDLGHRQAKRLYREARNRLRELLALAGGGGDDGDGGDESGRDPAVSGGSPAN